MKIVSLSILIFLSIQLFGQIKDYEKYSCPINASNDEILFSNSILFDSLLKNKRIVLLGELDHGDGTSLEVKTRLVKYLHEKHGFNTLVFESGLINCNQLWEAVKSGTPTAKFAKEHIYYIWSQVKETEMLFEYIDHQKEINTPLRLVGIDPQFSGRINEKAFIKMLESQLEKEEIQSKRFQEFKYELNLISQWMSFPKNDKHKIDEDKFYAHLKYYRNIVLSETKEISLWNLFFDNLITLTKIKWVQRKGSFELRDQQMFKNLKYWIKNNKEEKFIVWAANAHIIRNDKELKGKDSAYELIGLQKLGDHVFNLYPKESYSIAFSARKGKTLNFLNKRKTNKIKNKKKDSLEEKIKDLEYAFIDLKLFEKSMNLKEYESQLFYPNINCISQWSNHFDGIIFIDKMTPSTPKW